MTKTKFTRKKYRIKRHLKMIQGQALVAIFLCIIIFGLIVKYHNLPSNYRVIIFDENNQITNVHFTTDYKTAAHLMQKKIEQGYFNPAIIKDDKFIVAIKYGIVNLRTKECNINTYYTSEHNSLKNYVNGCYGSDAAYLETNDLGTQIKFKIAGDIGWIPIEEIELLNVFDTNVVKSQNHYKVEDQNLIHYGTKDLKNSDYNIKLSIGLTDSLPNDIEKLYSYDSHYFYDSYTKMIDDYRNQTFTNSLNSNSPHYNYYQYLSHRSKTSYVSSEMDWYIINYLGYTNKPISYPPKNNQSQLFQSSAQFVQSQNNYGANALMMLSLAINESNFGRSQIAIEKNNLFGHAAYDISPNESANGYKNVSDSIYTHANIFLNNGYLNPCDSISQKNPTIKQCFNNPNSRYAGGHFGDKASGMNVKYASDPYWGEKAAYHFQNIDRILGNKDFKKYQITVLESVKQVPIYALANDQSEIISYTPNYKFIPILILGEITNEEHPEEKWIKVQLDAQLTANRATIDLKPSEYNYKSSIGYIKMSDINE